MGIQKGKIKLRPECFVDPQCAGNESFCKCAAFNNKDEEVNMLTADFSRGLPDLRTGVYRHYKGPLYFVFGYGHDANILDRNVVVYMGLELTEAHKGPRLAIRTAEDFFALVGSHCGHDWECKHPGCSPTPRFEYLGSAWYGQR